MKQELIYITAATQVRVYLEAGWTIKEISADKRGCWVLLQKLNI